MPHTLCKLRCTFAMLFAGLALSAISAALAADIKMPAGLPPYGPMRLPEAPKVKSETLANGLTVWLVQQNNLPKDENRNHCGYRDGHLAIQRLPVSRRIWRHPRRAPDVP